MLDNTARLNVLSAILAIAWFYFIYSSIPLASNGDEKVKDGWRLIHAARKGSSDVSLYNKNFEGSPVLGVRGVCDVPLQFEVILGTFFDNSLSKQWVSDLHDIKVFDLKKNGDGVFLQRYRVAGGILVADREFLLERKIERRKGKQTLTVKYSSIKETDRRYNKYKVCKKCIRATSDETTWVFTKFGDSTIVDVTARIDPKGNLPPAVLNIIQKQWPKNSIKSLERLARKKNKVAQEFSMW